MDIEPIGDRRKRITFLWKSTGLVNYISFILINKKNSISSFPICNLKNTISGSNLTKNDIKGRFSIRTISWSITSPQVRNMLLFLPRPIPPLTSKVALGSEDRPALMLQFSIHQVCDFREGMLKCSKPHFPNM